MSIGDGNINSVNLSRTCIQKYFNKISSTIRQKQTASKILLVLLDDKINPRLDGTLMEKLVSVSV